MEAHHAQAIQRLVALLQEDRRWQALIIEGSIAHGYARPSSDIDVLLVASDEEYARRVDLQDFAYYNAEICDYPGGYIDGKIINVAFLSDAVQRANEPTRSAFVGAFVAFSRIPDLQETVNQISLYPEAERAEKMHAFCSQIQIHGGYFLNQALKRNDPYLLTHSVSELVLFGGRLLLAYNRILFPCHKTFLDALRKAPEKPAGIVELAEQVLRHPNEQDAREFFSRILSFREWGVTPQQGLNRFFQDSEWNWRDTRPPLADW